MSIQLCFAIFIIFFTILFLVPAFGLPFIANNGVLGEGFFPTSIAVILMILAIVYLWEVICKERTSQKQQGTKAAKKQVIYFLALIVCLAITDFAGMLISIGVFNIFVLVYLEKLSFKDSVIFILFFMVTIFLIFEKWLGLALPKGFLGI